MGELNIKSTTLEKSFDLLRGFLQKIIGPSIEEIGLTLGDNLKVWRFKNQLRNLEKVKKIVDERGINIKQINLKVLFPYLEGVSLEENDKIQDLWANLFVNYINKDKNLTVTVFPDILKQLSSEDVEILEYLVAHEESINILFDKTYKETDLSNLERLGIIKQSSHVPMRSGISQIYFNGIYKLTNFGRELILACSP